MRELAPVHGEDGGHARPAGAVAQEGGRGLVGEDEEVDLLGQPPSEEGLYALESLLVRSVASALQWANRPPSIKRLVVREESAFRREEGSFWSQLTELLALEQLQSGILAPTDSADVEGHWV